jgi:hypothetical protein
MDVIGQRDDDGRSSHIGHYLARDGSDGQQVGLDLERPHTGLIVGKRGSGKSHTLGVVAESVAATAGVTGVVVDPMGGLRGLADADSARCIRKPSVDPDTLPPRSWCALFGLDPADAVGTLVWRAAATTETLSEMTDFVMDADAAPEVCRGAQNYLRLAHSWEVFDPHGLDGSALQEKKLVVLDLSGVDTAPANAIVRAVSDDMFTTALHDQTAPLPWLLIDEAHVFFDGIAGPGLHRILRRGRHPGLSLIAATQRPAALPSVAVSQADLLVAHRLTATTDVSTLGEAQQSYHHERLAARLPTTTGAALVVDDTTESVHTVTVRDRRTPHGGETPRAKARVKHTATDRGSE